MHAANPGACILIVEDNADAGEMLSLLMDASGHSVVVAHCGEDALAQIDSNRFDVVQCDLDLADIDGYALAMKMRAIAGCGKARMRLVAMTGNGQLADRIRCERAGFDHLLLKPVSVNAVEQVVLRSAP